MRDRTKGHILPVFIALLMSSLSLSKADPIENRLLKTASVSL